MWRGPALGGGDLLKSVESSQIAVRPTTHRRSSVLAVRSRTHLQLCFRAVSGRKKRSNRARTHRAVWYGLQQSGANRWDACRGKQSWAQKLIKSQQ